MKLQRRAIGGYGGLSMAYSIDLERKVVLVCGVSQGGIGGATARKLADAGASVFCVDKEQDILDPTLADLEKVGVPHHGMVANLLYPEQSDPVVEAVWSRFGRLDGVANVCGGTRADEWLPLEETTLESYRETLNLNLEYVFRICRDAAKSMIKRDWTGSIVNIGSMSAIAGAPYHGPYGAAKSGIGALTRTMAFEWSRYGIRANTVNPGACSTEKAMRASNTVRYRRPT